MHAAWWDGNLDGVFTISDVWFVIKAFACMPGNFLIGFFGATEVGQFFEFTSQDSYTWFAWVLSVAVWYFVLRVLADFITPKRKRLPVARDTHRQ